VVHSIEQATGDVGGGQIVGFLTSSYGEGGVPSRSLAGDQDAELREIEQLILARRPEHKISPSLDRIRALVELLGDPQRAYPVIHITGTNGKTSTARMTETLLRVRGLRTGMFTSPHLVSIRERICVDGEPLSTARFVEVYREIEPYLKLVDDRAQVPLSFFEVLVGMAFAAFADAPVDVAVIEVGMGGTWDNTNVADGAVAVITPISIDHAKYLGDTVAAIAADKAGIIKPGAVAVLAQQPLDAAQALLRRTAEVGATVAREGIEFGVLNRELAVGGQRLAIAGLRAEYRDLFLPLFGAHQAGNAACALAAVEAFAGVGGPGGDQSALDGGLVAEAFAAMSSPGRLEIVRRSPVVLIDAAHNPAGMAATAAAMTESFGFAELITVLAVSADKDIGGILDQLEPIAAAVVATTNSSARSISAAALAELAGPVFGPDRVHTADRLDDAIELAVGLADESATALGGPVDGLTAGGDPVLAAGAGAAVLITGSVITAGDARLLLTGLKPA
jgi:dihydrofolate synthase / folylpolyglutamate synthase